MKGRYLGLVSALAVSMTALAAVGAVEKYSVLAPLELERGMDPLKLPFLLATDEGLRTQMDIARELLEEKKPTETPPKPTNPPEPTQHIKPTEPTEPTQPPNPTGSTEPTDAPTESPTDTPTESPTESSTESPTEPPTDAPTEPPTEPPTDAPTEPTTEAPPASTESQNPDLSVWQTSEHVDDAWFDDVLFIGDSRTVGLRDYCRIGNADYFCSVGMSVFNYAGKVESDKGYSGMTLEQLLKSKSYGKLIVSLGINECGYPMESLMTAYSRFVNKLRELQPDATIILQGIMAVSRGYASYGSYFSPSHLGDINERIRALADGVGIFYIDVNSAFADSEGYLPAYMSGDGCHLYIKYYQEWMNWLKCVVVNIPAGAG